MPSADTPSQFAFPASEIPSECHSLLPSGYSLRPLSSSDYHSGFNSVLSCLVSTPDLGYSSWISRFEAMRSASNTYYPIVIISSATNQIAAMGTVVVELKFFKGLTRVGHVEDIVVDTKLHGTGLGKVVVKTVLSIAEAKGCSNVILNCDEKKQRKYPFRDKIKRKRRG